MKPVDFDGTNTKLNGPQALSDLQYKELPAQKYGGFVTTLWKPSIRERLSILFSGRLWLTIKAENQPPTWIDGQRDVFNCCTRFTKKAWKLWNRK